MSLKFYNVKKRKEVEIPDSQVKKVVYKRKTSKGIQERYAVRAQDDDGTNLTKFINKKVFDKLAVPEVKGK